MYGRVSIASPVRLARKFIRSCSEKGGNHVEAVSCVTSLIHHTPEYGKWSIFYGYVGKILTPVSYTSYEFTEVFYGCGKILWGDRETTQDSSVCCSSKAAEYIFSSRQQSSRGVVVPFHHPIHDTAVSYRNNPVIFRASDSDRKCSREFVAQFCIS